MPNPHRIQVIDSHTAGEPTRVVVAGGPDLGGGSGETYEATGERPFGVISGKARTGSPFPSTAPPRYPTPPSGPLGQRR